jgi:hypothetical protein
MAGGEKHHHHYSPCHLGIEYTGQTYLTGQVNQHIPFFSNPKSQATNKEKEAYRLSSLMANLEA